MAEETTTWTIRSFRKQDLPACRKLYVEGLLGGKLAENDIAFDLDDIETVYLGHHGNHFWVAETDAREVIGMIGVQHYEEESTGQIRRLRVAQNHRRRGIGSALVETALKFCQDNQYLKITLESFMDREPALKLFGKFRFRLDRTRKISGMDMMYFYLDLYSGAPRHHKEDPGHFGQHHPG